MAGKDGSAGGIWHWHGKLSHGMRMLEAAKNSGSGGALSLEGKNQPHVLFHVSLFHLCAW